MEDKVHYFNGASQVEKLPILRIVVASFGGALITCSMSYGVNCSAVSFGATWLLIFCLTLVPVSIAYGFKRKKRKIIYILSFLFAFIGGGPMLLWLIALLMAIFSKKEESQIKDKQTE